VNAAKLTGPKRLDGPSCWIEFSNVRIDARILDEASSEHQTLRFAAMHLGTNAREPNGYRSPFHVVPEASENESPPTLRTGQRPSAALDVFVSQVA